MFEKSRVRKNRFLSAWSVTDGWEFGVPQAGQGLKELCALLGEGTELFVSVAMKNIENYVFSTLPEDEARYYIRHPETAAESETTRTAGIKVLESEMAVQGILSGILVLEVPGQTGEEEISEYKELMSAIRLFLYCCFFAEAYRDEGERDCFTGLLGDRAFGKDLRCAVAKGMEGYLIAVHVCGDGTAAEGLNEAIGRAAECCASICPDKAYRIGPRVLSLLYAGDKADTVAAVQKLMCEIPDSEILLESLDGADADGLCGRIVKWYSRGRNDVSFTRCEGLYRKLPIFEEDAI